MKKTNRDGLVSNGHTKVDISSPYIDINQVKTIDVNLEEIYGSLDDSQQTLKSMFMK